MGVGISQHDRENIDRIMGGYGDWFTARLLRLIAKADFENRAKLRAVYPEEVQAVLDWLAEPQDVPE